MRTVLGLCAVFVDGAVFGEALNGEGMLGLPPSLTAFACVLSAFGAGAYAIRYR